MPAALRIIHAHPAVNTPERDSALGYLRLTILTVSQHPGRYESCCVQARRKNSRGVLALGATSWKNHILV
jgi:hypothetical protein